MPRPFTVTGFQHKLRKRVDSGVQPEEHVEDLREQKRAASGEGVLVERERQPVPLAAQPGAERKGRMSGLAHNPFTPAIWRCAKASRGGAYRRSSSRRTLSASGPLKES